MIQWIYNRIVNRYRKRTVTIGRFYWAWTTLFLFCGEKEKKWKLLLSLLLFLQRTFFPEDKTYRQTILCVSLESFQSFLFSFWKIISAQKFYVEILPAYIPSPPLTTLCNCRHTKYIEKNKSFCTYRWRFENPSAWSARGINNQSIPHSLTRYTANGISTLSKHLSLTLSTRDCLIRFYSVEQQQQSSGCISFPLTADGALITSSRMEYVKVNAAPPVFLSPIYNSLHTRIERERESLCVYKKNFFFFFFFWSLSSS